MKTLKHKLQDLSRKMRDLGNMQDEYKGLAMYSTMSKEIQKCMLFYFMKNFDVKLSIIYVDTVVNKITWHNKPEFYISGIAICCIENKYVFVQQCDNNIFILNPFLESNPELSNKLLDIMYNMNIFDDTYIIQYDRSALQEHHQNGECLLISLLHVLASLSLANTSIHTLTPSIKNAEVLRLILGTSIYNHLNDNNVPPTALASQFEDTENCEHTVYVLC